MLFLCFYVFYIYTFEHFINDIFDFDDDNKGTEQSKMQHMNVLRQCEGDYLTCNVF